ncbi:uncharacterized protein LOC123011072 [Tribolium madens]|uniref:uncharacterized protein LOC123011072 n=1 Tax=Tribolium madens TaxID=41895 RepID=UPI001CF74F54|nr:uncharacterized protein LOC123011072 [Tribolium madens]
MDSEIEEDSVPSKRSQKRNPKQIAEKSVTDNPESENSESDTEINERGAKKRRIEEIIAKKVEEILGKVRPTTDPNILTQLNNKNADIVPPFEPESSEVTSSGWLNKIDQLGLIHGWSDETKSFYMQAKLAGIARIWYNGLQEYDKSWHDWKKSLLEAFPSHEYFVDNVKKMMQRKKQANESMMHYYYSKCSLIRKCEISDNNAVSCIIDGLPIEYQGTAKSGNFRTPEELYKRLLCKIDGSVPKTSELTKSLPKCEICKKPGHVARNCFFKSPQENHEKTRTTKKCSHCGKLGHERENCWYLNPRKVHLLQRNIHKFNGRKETRTSR